jgi:hypothetical protein
MAFGGSHYSASEIELLTMNAYVCDSVVLGECNAVKDRKGLVPNRGPDSYILFRSHAQRHPDDELRRHGHVLPPRE